MGESYNGRLHHTAARFGRIIAVGLIVAQRMTALKHLAQYRRNPARSS